MKKTATSILLSIIIHFCFGQTEFTFNQGGTKQINYFLVISYENIKGKIIVGSVINGKTYRFILDTGAPMTISSNLYDELKPTIINRLPITDQSGKKDSLFVVSLKEITIGDITFTDIPTLVLNQTLLLDCFHADGFIGSNLLRNSIVQFNDASKTVTVTNDGNKLTLNRKQSSALFLTKNQSSPFIWIKLKGKKSAREQLLFDSGMDGLYALSLSHYAAFEKYNILEILGKANGSYTIGAHGPANNAIQYKLRLSSMEINSSKLNNITIRTTENNDSRIGSKLLENGIVTIDYKNRKFYFEPFFSKEINLLEKDFPVELIYRNNQVQVGIVWDTTLADKIKAGDQIVAIDEISYENIDICNLVTKESAKNKEKITLTTKNQAGEIQKTIIEKK